MFDQGFASATNFLTSLIIARSCSKEELGLYMLGFSLILLVTDLQASLISTPYMIYAPRLKNRAHALYTGSTLLHQITLSLLIIVAIAFGAFVATSKVGPQGLGPVMWALAAAAMFIMFREYARRTYFTCLKISKALILDACIAVGQISGLCLLAYFGYLSASRAYWLIGFICGIASLVWLWSERSLYRTRINESVVDLVKNWIIGKWVFASGLVWAVSMNLYPWLLAVFHGTASTGVWAACIGVVALGNPAILGIQNFLGPKVSHVYAEEGARALRWFVIKASAAFSVPMLFFGVTMIFWGGPAVSLLYGHKYVGNGLVVTTLAWNLIVTAIASSFSRALFTIERADVDFAVNFVALFIMLTLGLWLVRSFGVAGAAFALLIANMAASGVRCVAFLILIRPECSRQIR